VTDSSGTVFKPEGVSRASVIAAKDSGETLSSLGARPLSLATALNEVSADFVVDTTATDFGRPEWGEVLDELVVRRGKGLLLAAKDAAAVHIGRWSDPELSGRVGINAVLGGTGRQLLDSIYSLRADWVASAFAGSASTTAIIDVLEAGGTLEDGLAVADERCFLEADPEFDLKGIDAALKLSVVAGALTGRPSPLVEAQDLRDVDPAVVRRRAEEGLTTRLVGEVQRGGVTTLGYQAIPKGSALDVSCEQVSYTYRLHSGETCIHRGAGLGAGPTAEAVLVDLEARFPVKAGGAS